MTLMWHPVTGQTFESPDSAVHQWLQSGWLPATEREEYERRIAERAALTEDKDATQASGSRGSKSSAASTKEA